jgi:hypothetical protein
VSVSDPAPERRHVPMGKPAQAAQRQQSVIRRAVCWLHCEYVERLLPLTAAKVP